MTLPYKGGALTFPSDYFFTSQQIILILQVSVQSVYVSTIITTAILYDFNKDVTVKCLDQKEAHNNVGVASQYGTSLIQLLSPLTIFLCTIS